MSQPADMVINITLVGPSAAGKSAMVARFVDDKYEGSITATIGVDFKIRTITLDDGRKIKLKIWDTSGLERFRTIVVSYMRSPDGVFLVYDITKKASLDDVESWYRDVQNQAPQSAITVLVGHKADEGNANKREVQPEEGERVAQRHGSYFVEASSLSNIGVNESFRRLTELIVKAKDVEQLSRDTLEQSRGDGAGGNIPPAPGPGQMFSQTVDYVRQRFQQMTTPASGSHPQPTVEESNSAIGSQNRHLWLVPELEVRSLEERAKRLEYERTLFKIAVVGSSDVGKTVFIKRLTTGMILEDDQKFKLQIWDTAGAERFRSVLPAILQKQDGVVITYDIGDLSSFSGLNSFRREVERHVPSAKIILADIRRQVSEAQGEALAKEWSCPFFEASAKLDINVTECFYQLTRAMAVARNLDTMRYGDGAGDELADGAGEAQQGVFGGIDFGAVKGAVQNVFQKFSS
ncbi:P-loop containing nucleoside triphosphate hydrolase protein [Panaeolus papilionaceus]|nr:P-loop containing nucleoside triphosphate hydrolase protein [Panaeolus papilionaceus]